MSPATCLSFVFKHKRFSRRWIMPSCISRLWCRVIWWIDTISYEQCVDYCIPTLKKVAGRSTKMLVPSPSYMVLHPWELLSWYIFLLWYNCFLLRRGMQLKYSLLATIFKSNNFVLDFLVEVWNLIAEVWKNVMNPLLHFCWNSDYIHVT